MGTTTLYMRQGFGRVRPTCLRGVTASDIVFLSLHNKAHSYVLRLTLRQLVIGLAKTFVRSVLMYRCVCHLYFTLLLHHLWDVTVNESSLGVLAGTPRWLVDWCVIHRSERFRRRQTVASTCVRFELHPAQAAKVFPAARLGGSAGRHSHHSHDSGRYLSHTQLRTARRLWRRRVR